MRALVFLWLVLATSLGRAEALSGEPQGTDTNTIPIPIYSTRPSEGSTFGFMPVFMVVRNRDQSVESIYAPSVSYNKVIHYTGTARWFHYPAPQRELVVTASASTKINWNAHIEWLNLPTEAGAYTDELYVRGERDVFERFFGFGPDTLESAETSYTRVRLAGGYRRGYNFTPHLNLGLRFDFSLDDVESQGVPDIPLSTEVFPNAPGMRGSTVTAQFIELRYDTRKNREYSRYGLYAGLQVGGAQGIWNSPAFLETQFDSHALIPETKWLQGSVRVYARYVNKGDVPFYHQSSLGGSNLMRGFIVDRFVDRGAWTAEFEQRIRLLRTELFGVVVDWRADPYIAFGQVFSKRDDILDHVRVAKGVGFRAWIQPNIVGRVDLGFAGEGLKIYVELGYPF